MPRHVDEQWAIKAVKELTERQASERGKALEKYGKDALLPAGRPEFDVLDYMINELVGMIRYAQMNCERFKMMGKLIEELPKGIRALLRDAVLDARELESRAHTDAARFIEIQQRLKAAGLHLGLKEQRYGG